MTVCVCVCVCGRSEEQCLVRSGLVKLLDRLCSLVDSQRPADSAAPEEEDDGSHRVTSLAWAAFQVLADHCVSWETQNSALLSSGLAQQVSFTLLTHLLNVLTAFLHNRAAESHEVWWDCST